MESSAFDKKYQLDTNENRAFLRAMTENLLAFGRRFPSPGGGSYWLGDDGTPWKDRNRETWITARMAHVYSLGYMLGYKECGALADAALKGLRGELHDEKNGGWYPGVTADGAPLPDKQCYAHAFVMLAASSGYLAGRPGAEELLRDAEAVYDAHFWDENEGLACDTWNTEFTVCDRYRGLNANMHSVEAFLAVADATGNEAYRARAGRRSTITRTGRRTLSATRTGRMTSSSRTARRRDTASSGQDLSRSGRLAPIQRAETKHVWQPEALTMRVWFLEAGARHMRLL